MGCTNPSQIINPYIKKTIKPETGISYNEGKKEFIYIKEVFFDVFNDILLKKLNIISDLPSSTLDKEIKSFYKEEKKNIKSNIKISKARFEKMVYYEISRKYLLGSTILKEYDIYQILENRLKSHFTVIRKERKNDTINKSELKWFSDLFDSIELGFARRQKVLNVYIDKDYSITKHYKQTLYEHFLYNDDFKVDSINLFLTPLLFTCDEILYVLCEILKQKEISFINLIIHPVEQQTNTNTSYIEYFNMDSTMYGKLILIISSLSKNKSIKFLSLSMTKASKVLIPPELSILLMKFMNKDTLVGLWLGKFQFSNQFLFDMKDFLSSSKNMKFLGLNFDCLEMEGMSCIKEIISKSKSLKGISITGMSLFDDEKEYKELVSNVMKNETLEMCYYNKSILNIEFLDDKDELTKTGGVFLGE